MMPYSVQPKDQVFVIRDKVMDFYLLLKIWEKILVKI